MSTIALACGTFAGERPVVRWQAGGHAQSVGGVVFAPDGQLVASASKDRTVKVWDLGSGQLLRAFTTSPGSAMHSVQFSPDGRDLIATGTGGGYRWRLSDGAMLAAYCCLETGYASATSPDGQLVAIGGSKTGLEETTLLMTLAGQLVRTFTNPAPHYVFAVLFSPDGSHVITGSGSPLSTGNLGVIRYWRISDGVETNTINAHAKRVNALALSPDGTLLASGSLDTTAKLWNAANGAFMRTLSGHTAAVTGLAFSPAGDELATSGADGVVHIWNPHTGALLRTLTGHNGPVGDVAWSPDGDTLLTGGGGGPFGSGGDATVRTWTSAGVPLRVLTRLTSPAEGVAVSADGRRVAVGTYLLASVHDASDGSLLRAIPQTKAIQRVALTRDGGVIAAGGSDGAVRVWRVGDGVLLHTLPGHNSLVRGLAISPDDQYILASDWDGPVRAWRLDTGALVQEYTTANVGGQAIAFAADGTWFAVAGGNVVQLRTFPTGNVIRTLAGHTASVNDVAVSTAGDLVLSGSSDRTARIWNAANGSLLHELTGHQTWVDAVAFSRDGRFAATGVGDAGANLRLWNTGTGALLETYDRDSGAGVTAVRFLSDNHGFAFARLDATLVVAENPFSRTPGDLNCDGNVDFSDINPFVLALTDPAGYAAMFPNCNILNGDVNGDGRVDFGDINPFVDLLSGGQGQPIPCP